MLNSANEVHAPFSDLDSPAMDEAAEQAVDTAASQERPPSPSSAPAGEPATVSFCDECREKINVALFLSILSVAAWSLAGNATRLALHSAFLSIPFFNTYEFFGPNCIGSFAMGLFAHGLPPEKEIPVIHRALGVGFCGSFTTFSSWVVDVVNKNSAGSAFEELLSGITMPFIFFLWGKDMALCLRWLCSKIQRRCCDNAREEENEARPDYTVLQYVFLGLSCAAAVAIPIGIQVRINQDHIHTVSSADIKAVALGPAGAVVRFLLSIFLNKRAQWKSFPVGTLAANAIGVFLVVFMDNYAHHRPENEWFWIVSNGICGALSTVSSFVNEVVGFYLNDQMGIAYLYSLISLAVTITIGAIGRRSNFD